MSASRCWGTIRAIRPRSTRPSAPRATDRIQRCRSTRCWFCRPRDGARASARSNARSATRSRLPSSKGRNEAQFPNVPGWSARDSAVRAVAEHRAWLDAPQPSGGEDDAGEALRDVAGRRARRVVRREPRGRECSRARAHPHGDGEPAGGAFGVRAHRCRGGAERLPRVRRVPNAAAGAYGGRHARARTEASGIRGAQADSRTP